MYNTNYIESGLIPYMFLTLWLYFLLCLALTTLEAPQNGSVHFKHEGTECDPVLAAYFSCDKGFNLSGNSVKKFQIDNQWTGPDPVCEGLYSTCSINSNTATVY